MAIFLILRYPPKEFTENIIFWDTTEYRPFLQIGLPHIVFTAF